MSDAPMFRSATGGIYKRREDGGYSHLTTTQARRILNEQAERIEQLERERDEARAEAERRRDQEWNSMPLEFPGVTAEKPALSWETDT